MAKKTKTQDEPTKDPLEALLESKSIKEQVYPQRISTERISTNSLLLDQILEGGFRVGTSRFTGNMESGKTSQGLVWGKMWQDHFENGFVIYFNAEGRITPDVLNRTGIDQSPEKFKTIWTNDSNTVYTIIEKMCHETVSGRRYFFIIDSYDNLISANDKDKSYDDAQKVAGQASINSVAGKRLGLPLAASGNHLYGVNQIRVQGKKMGPMMNFFDGASGGNALNFNASLIGKIKPPTMADIIYEKYNDPKSKVIGRYNTVILQKTYNEQTGMRVAIPIKYRHKGGVWREREIADIAIAHNFYDSGAGWKDISDFFAEEMKDRNIAVPSKIQGIAGIYNLFDNDPAVVEAAIDVVKKYNL